MDSNLASFLNDFYQLGLMVVLFIGFGFGCIFWWLVLKAKE